MTGYLILIFIMTFMSAVGSLFLKKASSSSSSSFVRLLMNINLYIGGLLYLGGAILNIIVLRHLEYSVVLPLTSFTYIWTMVLSYLILKEKITKQKVLGVMLIILGAIAVSI